MGYGPAAWEQAMRIDAVSLTGGEREYPFPDCRGGEQQRFAHIVGHEVRVEGDNLRNRLALGHQRDNRRDGNAEPTQAGHPPHLPGIGRDVLELHARIVNGDPGSLPHRDRHQRHRVVAEDVDRLTFRVR